MVVFMYKKVQVFSQNPIKNANSIATFWGGGGEEAPCEALNRKIPTLIYIDNFYFDYDLYHYRKKISYKISLPDRVVALILHSNKL